MLLEGKTGLILGIANKRSLAWGIAQSVAREGARLAVTYQGERLEENVRELAAGLDRPVILPCDVSQGRGPRRLADVGEERVGRARLRGARGGLRAARGAGRRVPEHVARGVPDRPGHLVLLAHRARAPRRRPSWRAARGSIVTLSYLGGERVVPHYNVMGVAKAALEMSVRYLAADLGPQGHPRERDLRRARSRPSPPPACTASRRCSSTTARTRRCARTPSRRRWATPRSSSSRALSRGITGEVIHVDGGFHVMGMAADVV